MHPDSRPDTATTRANATAAGAPFRDRFAAGAQLAHVVGQQIRRGELDGRSVVAGVTEGGMPLAYVLSLTLDLSFEPAPVQGITAPLDADTRIGVVVDDSVVHLDRDVGESLGASGATLDHLLDRAETKLDLMMQAIDDQPGASVRGRHVLLVDDLVDTGLTVEACAAWLRRWGAATVHAAVAAGRPSGLARAADAVDTLTCLHHADEDADLQATFARRGGGSTEAAHLQHALTDVRTRMTTRSRIGSGLGLYVDEDGPTTHRLR